MLVGALRLRVAGARPPGRSRPYSSTSIRSGSIPQLQVLLHQLRARRQEAVDVLELALDEALAQEERLLADLGEAFVAAPRRGFVAELGAEAAHHLAVAVADRQELVQRVDDRARPAAPGGSG